MLHPQRDLAFETLFSSNDKQVYLMLSKAMSLASQPGSYVFMGGHYGSLGVNCHTLKSDVSTVFMKSRRELRGTGLANG
jgi:hypothetical protein